VSAGQSGLREESVPDPIHAERNGYPMGSSSTLAGRAAAGASFLASPGTGDIGVAAGLRSKSQARILRTHCVQVLSFYEG